MVVLVAATFPAVPASAAAAGDVTVVASGLDAPSGVAVGGDGAVYVTAGDSLLRFGATTGTVASGLSAPRGIAVVGADVYVAEAAADRISRVPASGGAATPALATDVDGPTGLASDGSSLLIADTNHDRVLRWTPGAAPAEVANGLASPTGVAFGAGGSVLIADTFHGVVRRGSTVVAGGGPTAPTCRGDGGPANATALTPPTAVAGDGAGNVYVADAGVGRVVRVDAAGRLATIAVSPFPSALAVDGNGDLLIADSVAGTVVRVSSPATAFTAPVDRVVGPDRYATAAALSAQLFPSGGAPVAYLATGERFADALAASGAAGAAGGPVLLAQRDVLPDATAAELQRLHPARLVVLGGVAAITDAVADDAASAAGGIGVQRYAGTDRYGTAAALSAASVPSSSLAVVVTGDSFADSLSGGGLASLSGAPLLLTSSATLPDATATELRRLRPAKVVIVGGPNAVSPAVESSVRDATGGDVQRVAGADRYATSAAAANTVTSATTLLVATGENFPDGLAAAAAARKAGGPVLLAPCWDVPAPVRAARDRLAPADTVVVGGVTAVPDRPAALLSSASAA
jgi:putative cell wall-binding protein/sugar lactone lactonase YvrE